jgi:hypothetical protein
MAAGFHFTDDPAAFAARKTLIVCVPRQIRRKRELFGVLKKALQFPAYFGNNWDALNDCLRDLSRLGKEVQRVVLIHDGIPFAPQSRSRRIYLELLRGLATDPPSGAPEILVVFPRSAAAELSSLT